MQLEVMSGLGTELVGSHAFDKAGWLLIFVPAGAFLGALFAAYLTRRKMSARDWPLFLGAWSLASLSGFPLALLAPLLLAGGGPDPHGIRFLAFVVEYGLAWGALFLLFRAERRKL